MTAIDISTDAVARLANGFHGHLVTPTDPAYDEARTVWNATVDRFPQLVARAADETDVVRSIAFARDHGLPLAVRGGGHNVSGASVCDNGVVISLDLLTSAVVDPHARVAKVGGGALWSHVDAAGAPHGLHTTGGLISHTGVGGLTLGGGIGWLMRKHGLTCDNLLAATLVVADGRVVEVDEEREPELLWALRGGGGNFGVVTSFTFRLHEVAEILGGMLLYRGSRAREAAAAYAQWADSLPDEITTLGAYISAPPEPFVPAEMHLRPAFAVVVAGLDPEVDVAYVDALRRTFAPDVDVTGPLPYVAQQQMSDAAAPPGLRNYWKSGCLRGLEPSLLEQLAISGLEPRSPLSAIHLHQMGGATRDSGRAGRAVTSLGDAAWVLNVVGTWSDPAADAENVAWVRDLWGRIEDQTFGTYTNFLGDEGLERTRAAFDAESWRRLVAVKQRWDPDNVFRLNQNIPLQSANES